MASYFLCEIWNYLPKIILKNSLMSAARGLICRFLSMFIYVREESFVYLTNVRNKQDKKTPEDHFLLRSESFDNDL